MVALARTSDRMTVAEFLHWEPGDARRWQLVDGEPAAMAPASRTHAALQSELGRVIGNHLLARSSPCTILAAPGIVPNALAGHNFRIPDLAVSCTDSTVEESALADPILIIEVLSPSNRAETWANVWAYTSIPSVREILVLHSHAIAADLLRRQPDGTWPKEPDAIEAELALHSIGFRIPLAELYRTTRLRSVAPPNSATERT